MRILFIDNYDSFTYNVVEILRQFEDVELTIVKNDALSGLSIHTYDKLIISPGPDLPRAAGGLVPFLENNLECIPTLGICLGHQAIVEHYGGSLLQYENPRHGEKTTLNILNQGTLFEGLPKNFDVGLYHSWYSSVRSSPDCLIITAQNEEGIVMATQHESFPIYTVQFHPESYMSEYGKEILQNFVQNG